MHADLIYGLKTDKYGIEFLINNVKADGIISTRADVITQVKRHRVMAIQRLFALDSHALNHNLEICRRVQPDYLKYYQRFFQESLKKFMKKRAFQSLPED